MADLPNPVSDVTIFVCVSCTVQGAPADRPGQALYDAVASALGSEPGCKVKPVDCLAVCKRPCTVALAADDKWTYIVGDLSPDANAQDVIAAAKSYGASANGIIPWRERPQSFRKGVIARVPPLAFRPEAQGL
jgi:predicted metal-binding protein